MTYWMRANWLPFAAFLLVAGALIAEVALALAVWPSDWSAEQQVALGGALLTQSVAVVSIPLKVIFDEVSLNTKSRLTEREAITAICQAYAAHYLMPMAGWAQELARHLMAFKHSERDAARERAADGAFFACANYTRLYWALAGLMPFPNVDRPLGVFLKSAEKEQLVWDLMMPPWVFGLSSLREESCVIQGLWQDPEGSSTEEQAHVPPAVFLSRAHSVGDPLAALRAKFHRKIAEHPHLAEVIDVLIALNEVVNYEVKSALDSWYGARRGAAPRLIQAIAAYPLM